MYRHKIMQGECRWGIRYHYDTEELSFFHQAEKGSPKICASTIMAYCSRRLMSPRDGNFAILGALSRSSVVYDVPPGFVKQPVSWLQ